MDVKEFRTGNLLNYTTAEGDILPYALDWQDLKWLEEDKEGFELVHDYIPLTEQWLLDFGFEEKYLVTGLGDREAWFKGSFYIEKNFFYGYLGGNIKLKHVHQLQNLYYSLTGEELTKK